MEHEIVLPKLSDAERKHPSALRVLVVVKRSGYVMAGFPEIDMAIEYAQCLDCGVNVFTNEHCDPVWQSDDTGAFRVS